MNTDTVREALKNLLIEMSYVAKSVSEDERYKSLVQRFNVFPVGENFNCVLSSEVFHSLKKSGVIDISLEDFTKLIPSVCQPLHMELDALMRLEDAGQAKPPTAAYYIKLF